MTLGKPPLTTPGSSLFLESFERSFTRVCDAVERFIGRPLCWVGQHRWIDHPLSYRQGKVWATIGHDPDPQQINCTWVCDEVCARCGGETWWPS